MIRDYIVLVFKSLGSRKTRSWLTMIGIFIGIAAIVSLISLGEGLRTAISSQFGFLGTDILSVQAAGITAGPPGTGVVDPLTSDLVDAIADVPNVEAVFPRYIATASMIFNDEQDLIFLTSVPDENRKVFERITNIEVSQGRLLRDADRKGVVLGADVASEENLGKPIRVGEKVLINDMEFEVIGITEPKGSFTIDSAVFINQDSLLEYFDADEDEIDIIAVQVSDEGRMDDTQERIEKILRKERDVEKGEEDFTVQSPQQAIENLNSTLFAVQLFIYIIAGISLVVGGIGIMNTMYTAVLERTNQIGIMKAIGARNETIFRLFFIESGMLGMVGGIVGVVIGVLIAVGASAAGRAALGSDIIQADFNPLVLIGALLFSFIVGTLAGVLPALSAAKMQPVEALRYEK